jgi:hypothetical protein
MKRITTKEFCTAFNIKPHTLRAAAKRLGIKDDEYYGRLLLTPQQVLEIVLSIRVEADSITEKETRKKIRSALFDYCVSKR